MDTLEVVLITFAAISLLSCSALGYLIFLEWWETDRQFRANVVSLEERRQQLNASMGRRVS